MNPDRTIEANRHAVISLMNALARRNLEAAQAFAADGFIREVVDTVTYSGPDALETLIQDAATICNAIEVTVTAVVAEGDFVVVEHVDTVFLNNGVVDVPSLGLFTLVDGRVQSWKEYQNISALSEALGY